MRKEPIELNECSKRWIERGKQSVLFSTRAVQLL